MKPSATLVPLLCALVLGSISHAQGDYLYSVTSTQGYLRKVDPLTGTTIQFTQMVTNNAVNAQGCTGLARNPVTGVLYAIMREVSQPTVRKLASINHLTGTATIIGALGDNFAGLAFRSDGTLFAVTGDGAVVPETLYTLDLNSAAATFVMPLGNGGPGETIASAADGFFYHCSGWGALNADQILERIDPFTLAVTPITLSGYDSNEILSLTEWVGGNLLAVDLNDQAMVITTGGVATFLAGFDHAAVKGLSFVPSPPTQPFFRPYGSGCAAVSGRIPLLAHAGVPTPGQNAQLRLILAPPSATVVIAIGFGTAAAPIPSPTCQVQVLPIDPNLQFFTTAGAWTLSVTVPPIPPQDLYAQAAVVDAGGALVVSNPLQVHVQ
jgi:hypothetical protein